jgi:hypothetical protein
MGQIALATCWYTRRHLPDLSPRYRQDGAYRGVCRYCRSSIHSHDRKHWRLSDGFDLDELAGSTDYIEIVDQGGGTVLGRVPIDAATPDQLNDKLAEVRQHYEGEQGQSALSLVVHWKGRKRVHAY